MGIRYCPGRLLVELLFPESKEKREENSPSFLKASPLHKGAFLIQTSLAQGKFTVLVRQTKASPVQGEVAQRSCDGGVGKRTIPQFLRTQKQPPLHKGAFIGSSLPCARGGGFCEAKLGGVVKILIAPNLRRR